MSARCQATQAGDSQPGCPGSERVLPCRVLPAEATGQPGCHLSVGVPGGPDGRHHSPGWRTRPARCRPMRAGARCDRRCLGAMGGDHPEPRRDCEPGTIALRRYSDSPLSAIWGGWSVVSKGREFPAQQGKTHVIGNPLDPIITSVPERIRLNPSPDCYPKCYPAATR